MALLKLYCGGSGVLIPYIVVKDINENYHKEPFDAPDHVRGQPVCCCARCNVGVLQQRARRWLPVRPGEIDPSDLRGRQGSREPDSRRTRLAESALARRLLRGSDGGASRGQAA